MRALSTGPNAKDIGTPSVASLAKVYSTTHHAGRAATPRVHRKRVWEQLAAQPRAFTRAHLLEQLGRYGLDHFVSSERLVRILPGIYVAASWQDSFIARARATSMWVGRHGAVTGSSAARIWGLTDQDPTHVDAIAIPTANARTPPWLRLRRVALPHKTFTKEGVRVVTMADAVLQGWASLPVDRGVGFVIDAIRSGNLDASQLAARSREYPRLTRSRELARLLELLGRGVDSYLEYWARTRVFTGSRFHQCEWQVPVVACGARYVLDMVHRDSGVAVEFDGRQFHSDDGARRRDLERDANLAAEGMVTLRLTYEDIMSRPQWCRDRVLSTIAARLGGRRALPPAS